MNKKILDAELDLNFHLIAITTQLKGYRLCFLINKFLNMGFERMEFDYCIAYPGVITKFFSQFYFKNSNENEFFIFANKGSEGILIPELKETDYIMLLKNYFDKEELAITLAGIKQINEIQVAIQISPQKLKSKENLIF
ncbi:MAG: IPExxxVDY family protein [Sphingobacteriales bacterium]|nr:MAG: IPExxxVDY family protein [Sphingobacteriales bacterium]